MYHSVINVYRRQLCRDNEIIYFSFYGDFYVASFFFCALQSYVFYAFFHTAYESIFIKFLN